MPGTQRYPLYETLFAQATDVETQTMLKMEEFALKYPPLPYMVLVESKSIVDEFYGTSKRSGRVYDTFRIPVKPLVEPEEAGLTAFAVDWTRNSIFHIAAGALESLKIAPKIGDIIEFDGDRFEVKMTRRWKESRVGETNSYLVYEFITAVESRDWE